jgi:hypothetical protein
LNERVEAVRGLRPDHPAYDALLNCFERSLVTMHKMPKVWEMLMVRTSRVAHCIMHHVSHTAKCVAPSTLV